MGLFDMFKKKKSTPAIRGTTDSKDEIMKMLMQEMSQKAPSERFASGAVFDITRKCHDQFAQLVNSNNVMALKDFFVKAYITFCNQPQIVGFAPSMVNVNLNDTNPGMWNVDVMNLPSGEKVALCFMPINDDVLEARIIGIVLGDGGDRYYYCMLNKDRNILSDVKQNKAMHGITSIGSVNGRGFELMNDFVRCIGNS